MMRLAIYDLDGTLLDGDSHASLLAELVLRSPVTAGARARIVWGGLRWAVGHLDDDGTKALAARALAGMDVDGVAPFLRAFVERRVLPRVRPSMAARVRSDRDAGYTTLLLSASLDEPVAVVARALGFDRVAGTRLATERGVLTGHIEGDALRGEAKARYLERFAREHGADLSLARGYGDRESDGAFLALVGEPFAVRPDRGLRRLARVRGWPIIE